MNKPKELFAGYIPVLHDGYITAFNRHPDAAIGVFNDEVLADNAPYLRKDIRALSPEDAKRAITGLGREALILGRSALQEALRRPIIMPSDDISRAIIAANPEADITTEPVFLRWDRDNSTDPSIITPDRTIQISNNDPIIKRLNSELVQSTNWWRHIGAVILDDTAIKLSAHNSSLPTEYTSWINGDPRITARKGESIERSIDIHAEARIIAEASKQGIALEGMTICVSTFPCPNCAKLIALSGIKSCYFVEGYSVLDGYSVLKDFGVEVVKLETDLEPEDPQILKAYPSNQS